MLTERGARQPQARAAGATPFFLHADRRLGFGLRRAPGELVALVAVGVEQEKEDDLARDEQIFASKMKELKK